MTCLLVLIIGHAYLGVNLSYTKKLGSCRFEICSYQLSIQREDKIASGDKMTRKCLLDIRTEETAEELI